MRLAIEPHRAAPITLCLFWILLTGASKAVAQASFIHGVWVWKTETVLAAPKSGEELRDFCRSQTMSEAWWRDLRFLFLPAGHAGGCPRGWQSPGEHYRTAGG